MKCLLTVEEGLKNARSHGEASTILDAIDLLSHRQAQKIWHECDSKAAGVAWFGHKML